MFSLSDIQNNKATCLSYTSNLTLRRPLQEVITQAHTLCPELKEFVTHNLHKFNSTKKKDKGNLGKVVEFYLFGQLPNCDANPDLGWGADIKATHLKVLKSGHYNAKERLTITNCGKTEDYSTFDDVSSASSLKTCKYYPKIQKGVLCVFEHCATSDKYSDPEQNLTKRLLDICVYDTDTFPEDIQFQLQQDFRDIQNKILNQAVSQKGQQFLHIHPHGSKDSTTRAFGFTNKFLTSIIAYCSNIPVTSKGRSSYIEKQYYT